MSRYGVTRSFERAEDGGWVCCYGVRMPKLPDICFRRERHSLRRLVRRLNLERAETGQAMYMLEDFCIYWSTPWRENRPVR